MVNSYSSNNNVFNVARSDASFGPINTFNKDDVESSEEDESDDDSDDESSDNEYNAHVSNFKSQDQFQRQTQKPYIITDRQQTASQKTRKGVLGSLAVRPAEIIDEDYYDLVARNPYLQSNLDDEIRGFAIYLVNGNNLDMINACNKYTKSRDIGRLCNDIDEICNNFAEQFYDREFTDDQVTDLQESGDLEEIFANFSQTGNIVLFKNQLLNLIKKKPEPKKSILGTLQKATEGKLIPLNEEFSSPMRKRGPALAQISHPPQSPVRKRGPPPSQQASMLASHSPIPRQNIESVFQMILQLDLLSKGQRDFIGQLMFNADEGLTAIAEVYLLTLNLADMRENIEVMLHCAGHHSLDPPDSPHKITFEQTLHNMERQGEISGIEKQRLVNLYHHDDERVVGIWNCYNFTNDVRDFSESILLFAGAISIHANQSSKVIGRRKSIKTKPKPKEQSILMLQQMSVESEELEEEEEEEEEETDVDEWNKAAANNVTGEHVGADDAQVRNTFIELQHRIIRRFCLNAKVPLADGAKFHQLINDCDQRIISSFECFAMNRNEDDFLENLNIVADIMKSQGDVESPDGKGASAGVSPSSFRQQYEEQEKKLLDLEPMEEDDEEEYEEEKEEQIIRPLQNGVANGGTQHMQHYTPDDISAFSELINNIKDNFSDSDISMFQNLLIGGNTLLLQILETYQLTGDKEDVEQSLTLFLNQMNA